MEVISEEDQDGIGDESLVGSLGVDGFVDLIIEVMLEL